MTETYSTEDFVRALKGATLTAYSGGQETYVVASGPASSKELESFVDLTSELHAVDKTEVTDSAHDRRRRRGSGRRMTNEIDADPEEVARLRLSRQQAREGMVRWDPEEGDSDAR